MRVALITTSFPMTLDSADGIFVARLADALSAHAQLTVITPEGVTGPPAPRANYRIFGFRYAPRRWQSLAHGPGGIPVMLRKTPWSWLFLPSFLVALFLTSVRAARQNDVLHANWAAVGAIVGLAGWFCRTPVVTTLRGADVGRLEQSVTERLMLRVVLATNARLISVSDAIRKQVERLSSQAADRLVVIYNGIDDKIYNLAPISATASKTVVRFLTVSSLIPRKSVATLIEALAKTGEKGLELEIVGDGPERLPLEKLAARLGLSDRVHFIGWIAPNQVPNILVSCDAFVLTSRSEGRPNALLEAMAAGLPVVGPDIPGVVELIDNGRTGLLYEQGNPSALASHLKSLSQDGSLRQDLGSAAKSDLDRRGLRWHNTAHAYFATYCSALGKT